MAFLFTYALDVTQAGATMYFDQKSTDGVYLQYDC